MTTSFLSRLGGALLVGSVALAATRCGGDDFAGGPSQPADSGVDAPATDAGGNACAEGSKLCDDKCVPFDDPAFGCGAPVCDPCPALNGDAFCKSGCQVQCNAGYDNCDANLENGCETYTNFDPLNCGSCGNKCAPGDSCLDGKCITSGCTAGKVQCTSGGPCIDLGTQENCAHCSDNCTLPNTQSACQSGKCAVTGCNPGFADCDKDPKNGCEADLATSGKHCGACDRGCSTANAKSTQCIAGQCVPSCERGDSKFFSDCKQPAAPAPDDGCETSINTIDDCGGCGLKCQPDLACVIRSNSWPGCACTADKQCTVQAPGTTTATSCTESTGTCRCAGSESCQVGEVCIPNAAAPVCDCGGVSCKFGHHCCNKKCVNVNTEAKNCGACGIECSSGQVCVQGQCT